MTSKLTQRFKAKVAHGLRTMTAEYYLQCDRNLREPRQWPAGFGTTHRRSGEVVAGSFRNIQDLGNLADSGAIEKVDDLKYRVSWDGNGETPAILVKEGYVTSKGNVVPGRDWTNEAIDTKALEKAFEKGFRAKV